MKYKKNGRPISRVLSWMTIYLGSIVTNALMQPTRSIWADHPTAARLCFRRGLPCPNRYRLGGGPLPHLFTLTTDYAEGGIFSVALSMTPLQCLRELPGAVSYEARTFLYCQLGFTLKAAAAIRSAICYSSAPSSSGDTRSARLPASSAPTTCSATCSSS